MIKKILDSWLKRNGSIDLRPEYFDEIQDAKTLVTNTSKSDVKHYLEY